MTDLSDNPDDAAQRSLHLLGYGNGDANWIAPLDDTDHDVVVVGGGQSGVAIAYALRRAGVARTSVVDAGRDESDLAWQSRARNLTLRTPKTVSGPELGNPALTFQVWFDATHGEGAFDGIDRIATSDWADYLEWFRRQVGIEVRRGVRLTDIEPVDDGRLRLHLENDERTWTEDTRKLVLATGVSGTGGPYIPAAVAALSDRVFAHTADEIDFDALRDRSVAVLGAAASAYDAAATALEAGAGDVHVYTRRPELVVAPLGGTRPNPLAQDVFHLLGDEERWRQRWRTAAQGANVPPESVERAAVFENYYLHLDAEWLSASEEDGRVIVHAADGTRTFDFVIAGTGYQQDPATRPELSTIAPYVARWADAYPAPEGLESELLASAPYLGSGYELTEREPGAAPWLRDIHVFSIGAAVSFGRPVGDIPSLRVGVPRLVEAITRDLVLADLRRARSAAVGGPVDDVR
ncbi:SidA/IucD/PvdA family monooxygenase [Rhodococcus sp. NPDC003382]|uniref:SidA/IucD/PvdA family monooxygenase n=1 Tax=unclassified Rhodococcus (in: high G+C Gram-positive bacteria) TaxID=192944 RepID=UPI0018CD82D3|nr:SidA/IucD/PvdA family monooxygenase [Rhodococcus sp. CX]MBH0118810.1 NAD(P)/FAD-dependent oxidoreductase [Rhodococcus sp. CX]